MKNRFLNLFFLCYNCDEVDDRMKKFVKNNKLILVGVVILIVLIAILAIIVSNTNKEKKTIKKYENIVSEMTSAYYKDYYSMIVDSKGVDYIKAFEDVGFEFDLDNMINLLPSLRSKAKELVNVKTGEQCNINGTKVMVYPKDPYGENDYTIKVTLDCGFDK